VERRIEGLVVRRATTHEDDRGDLVEIFRTDWGFHPKPVVQVYQASLRPGAIKGWVMHLKQDDRIFALFGFMRWVFYDARTKSPTQGLLHVITISERTRSLIVIPAGVYHAVQNIGLKDASFINLPTRAYDYAKPDKLRLPLENDLIPFRFDARTQR
jgi:dTDP-4-dehydrorhamnose 3,5-epimerase